MINKYQTSLQIDKPVVVIFVVVFFFYVVDVVALLVFVYENEFVN